MNRGLFDLANRCRCQPQALQEVVQSEVIDFDFWIRCVTALGVFEDMIVIRSALWVCLVPCRLSEPFGLVWKISCW